MRPWTRMKGDPRWIEAKYGGLCSQCGAELHPGDRILYWPRTRTVMCEKCGESAWQRFVSEAADEEFMSGGLF